MSYPILRFQAAKATYWTDEFQSHIEPSVTNFSRFLRKILLGSTNPIWREFEQAICWKQCIQLHVRIWKLKLLSGPLCMISVPRVTRVGCATFSKNWEYCTLGSQESIKSPILYSDLSRQWDWRNQHLIHCINIHSWGTFSNHNHQSLWIIKNIKIHQLASHEDGHHSTKDRQKGLQYSFTDEQAFQNRKIRKSLQYP